MLPASIYKCISQQNECQQSPDKQFNTLSVQISTVTQRWHAYVFLFIPCSQEFLSRAHEILFRARELLSRAHDIISQSENTLYIHECYLKLIHYDFIKLVKRHDCPLFDSQVALSPVWCSLTKTYQRVCKSPLRLPAFNKCN